MNFVRKLPIVFAVPLILLAPLTASAQRLGISTNTTPPPVSDLPKRDIPSGGVPTDCSLIGFEGVGNNLAVGTYFGPVTVAFGASWLGLIDADAGGNGNFANEPSPNTAAYFLDQNDISITLTPAVRFVQFHYTAAAQSLPITVYAYDAANNLITSVPGSTVGTDFDGAACVGDPTGQFCLWDQISLISGSNNIASVKITGAVSNQFGIDNLYFCTSTTPTKSSSWGSLKSVYR